MKPMLILKALTKTSFKIAVRTGFETGLVKCYKMLLTKTGLAEQLIKFIKIIKISNLNLKKQLNID
jgi:hypothetical protein